MEDNHDIAFILIDQGARCDLLGEKNDEMTPLQAAAFNEDIPLIMVLLHHGAAIDYANSRGTALAEAAENYRWKAFDFLISAGANPNIPSTGESGGFPPLLVIANSPGDSDANLNAIKILLKSGADPNYRSKQWDGQTALMCASSQHLVRVIRALLDAGADVNAAEFQAKETALTIAGDHGFEDVVELLMAHGAHPSDLHIIKHWMPNPPPSPSHAWALAVGAMYDQQNGGDPFVLGDIRNYPPDLIQEDIEHNWGIRDAKELSAKLDYLINSGDRAAARTEGAKLAAMPEKVFTVLVDSFSQDPQKQAHLQAVRKSFLRWKDRTGLAFDLCSSVNLINHGFSANYLTEKDSWARLLTIAREAQTHFSSWQELGENFLDGREVETGSRDPNFQLCVRLLSDPHDPNSAWTLCPWSTDLSK